MGLGLRYKGLNTEQLKIFFIKFITEYELIITIKDKKVCVGGGGGGGVKDK